MRWVLSCSAGGASHLTCDSLGAIFVAWFDKKYAEQAN